MDWNKLYEDGDYATAASVLKEQLAFNPKDPSLLEAIGLCSHQLHDLAAAEEYLMQAMEVEPSLDRLYNIISVKYQADKFIEVIHLAVKYLEIEASNFAVWDMLGTSYFHTEQYQAAIAAFTEAGKIDHIQMMQEKIAVAEKLLQQRNEKHRIETWAEEFYSYSKFGTSGRARQTLTLPGLFRDQILEYKLIENMLANHIQSLYDVRVLDVGCGEGRWLRKFVDWGAQPKNLAGIDVNSGIISLAQQLSAPEINFVAGHADVLPYQDKSFDIILVIGVLQHILDPILQQKIGQELLRVLSEDGMIISYNYNKRGRSRVTNTVLTKNIIGIETEELKNFFGDNVTIFYEDGFLSDGIIHYVAESEWGKLYDLAVNPTTINHGSGFSIIKK